MRIAKYTLLLAGLVSLTAGLLLADDIAPANETPTIENATTENAAETADTNTDNVFDTLGVTEENARDAAEATKEATEFKPQTVAGRGRQASKKFTLGQGLAIFRTAYKGDSNYIVSLVNANGEEVQSLFNQIGAYEGSRGFEIKEAGEYLLNVQSNGDWTFTIEQPRPTSGQAMPTAFKGNRTDVTPFLSLKKGLAVFKMTFKGDGRFAATLTDQNGRPVEYLVNTLKNYEGSAPVKVPAEGIYFLNVSADGDWQIEIH